MASSPSPETHRRILYTNKKLREFLFKAATFVELKGDPDAAKRIREQAEWEPSLYSKRDEIAEYARIRTVRGPNCWTWTGQHINGYAVVPMTSPSKDGPQTYTMGARVVWESKHKKTLGSDRLYRTCGNKGCVNPDHGTVQPGLAATPRPKSKKRAARQLEAPIEIQTLPASKIDPDVLARVKQAADKGHSTRALVRMFRSEGLSETQIRVASGRKVAESFEVVAD
jgi:hypothetical protein